MLTNKMENRTDYFGKNALLLVFLIIVCFSFAQANDLKDLFALDFVLTEGGFNRIELNPNNLYKGVRLEVIKRRSDINQQYEILQQVVSFQKKGGVSALPLIKNFVVRRLFEGPAAGTFYIQPSNVAVSSISRIYMSNSLGTGVSFTLVYGLEKPDSLPAGEYTLQVNFVLRAVGANSYSGQLNKVLFIDVRIPERAAEKTDLEIIPVSGYRAIKLNSHKEMMKSFDLEFKFNRRPQGSFSLTQLLLDPLRSEKGVELPENKLMFTVRESKNARAVTTNTPLGKGRTIFYSVDSGGRVDENFLLTYSIGDLKDVQTGLYKGKIFYYLEQAGKPSELKGSFNIELEVEPVLELELLTDRSGEISFYNIKPGEASRTSELIINIKTNIGKRYQVTQSVFQELTDPLGRKIPSEKFTMRLESINSKGTLRFSGKMPVKKGDTTLFVSDDYGSSDSFKIIYELEVPKDVIAGDYSTRITYSLIEH